MIAISATPPVPSRSPAPPRHTLVNGTLALDSEPLLTGLPSVWSLAARNNASPPSHDTLNATIHGVFIRWMPPPEQTPASYHETPLGHIANLSRFTSCHRFVPFWLRPIVGKTETDIKPETLWILAEINTSDKTPPHYLLIIPLLAPTTRHALRSSTEGLAVTSETGAPSTPCDASDALYIATGQNPYALLNDSAQAVSQHQNANGLRGKLRRDKPTPDFIENFGWCTWDAFYKNVAPKGVLSGLETFAEGGVSPRFLIIDDGWQSTRRAPSGEEYLSTLSPNSQFTHDLAPLIRKAKQQHNIQQFLVWHALLGYWGGIDPKAPQTDALPDYGVRLVPRLFGPGVLEQEATWNIGPWGAQLGVPPTDRLAAFYDDYHRLLAEQGVDGVKVDAQALLESVAWQQGGRVPLTRATRHALETSIRRHFDGRLINCMCATNECATLSSDSTLLRTSDDFWPERPETHGAHLHTNAQVSLWLGEFMQPDWDMFQSAHTWGAYHAAARAVSGGPVYVSDKVGGHDFSLLKKLVLSDGTILRADFPGLPSPDCLFADPTRDSLLLKIFNRNRDCGVLGVFNAHDPDSSTTRLHGAVSPDDIPDLPGNEFVAWSHRENALWLAKRNGISHPLCLSAGDWEIITFAPIENGFAAIGLADKFNSSGAITYRKWHIKSTVFECHLTLRDGGMLLAWSARRPEEVTCNGCPLSFAHDAASARLTVLLPTGCSCEVSLRWTK